MAIIPQQEDENNNSGGQSSGATGGSQTVPQTGGGASGVVGSQGASSQGGSTQKGTGFVNTQDYVKANQGQNFGSQVAGDVGNVAKDAVSSLGNVQNTFKQQADANTVKRDEGIFNQLRGGRAADIVGNADNLKRYNTMANARYGGPKELSQVEGFGDLAQKYGKARSYLDNTATDQGRYALLGDLYNRPNYTSGMRNLDQTILQADPNSRNQLQGLRDKYSGIDDDIDVASQEAQRLAQQKQAESSQLRDQLRSATSQQWSGLNDQLTSAMQRENAARDKGYQQELNSRIQNAQRNLAGRYNPDMIADAIRNSASQGAQIKDISQVAGAGQVAQYNALAQLMGLDNRISEQKANPYFNIGNWWEALPNATQGGSMRRGGASSGGYAEQTRRRLENSAAGKAVGGAASKANPAHW